MTGIDDRRLVKKHRKAAVHWIRPDPADGLLTVACGTAVPFRNDRANITTDPGRATCEECHQIAHPTKSVHFGGSQP